MLAHNDRSRSTCWWSTSTRSRRRSPPAQTTTTAIENIDVGGPAMIRGAAKNHADVAVVVDPDGLQPPSSRRWPQGGTRPRSPVKRLAQKAFARTAVYDAAISNWMARGARRSRPEMAGLRRHADRQALRYGENPHQQGSVLRQRRDRDPAWPQRGRSSGKPLCPTTTSPTPTPRSSSSPSSGRPRGRPWPSSSTPIPAAWRAGELRRGLSPRPALRSDVGLRRHRRGERPARRPTPRARSSRSSPRSSSRRTPTRRRWPIVAAKKNLRLLLTGALPDPRAGGLTMRTVAGGFLVQGRDNAVVDDLELQVVTRRAPTEAEAGRSALRLLRRQARQVQRDRLRPRRRDGRHRRRPDEPARFVAHGGDGRHARRRSSKA